MSSGRNHLWMKVVRFKNLSCWSKKNMRVSLETYLLNNCSHCIPLHKNTCSCWLHPCMFHHFDRGWENTHHYLVTAKNTRFNRVGLSSGTFVMKSFSLKNFSSWSKRKTNNVSLKTYLLNSCSQCIPLHKNMCSCWLHPSMFHHFDRVLENSRQYLVRA